VVCSRGTYVRTLADDMGEMLCCGGALKELRRISSGPFDISTSVTLEGLEEAVSLGNLESLTVTPCAALSHLPDICLNDTGLEHVRYGRSIEWHDTKRSAPVASKDGDLVRLTKNGCLIAVAECRMRDDADSRIILKRVFI